MPRDPSLVDRSDTGELVRRILAEVLMVPIEKVCPETKLVAELGAESIDFLDLVFRLEDTLGKRIPASRWSEFVRERTAGQDPAIAITTDLVREFAEREASL